MAQDVAWPSEDEDFDATTTKAGVGSPSIKPVSASTEIKEASTEAAPAVSIKVSEDSDTSDSGDNHDDGPKAPVTESFSIPSTEEPHLEAHDEPKTDPWSEPKDEPETEPAHEAESTPEPTPEAKPEPTPDPVSEPEPAKPSITPVLDPEAPLPSQEAPETPSEPEAVKDTAKKDDDTPAPKVTLQAYGGPKAHSFGRVLLEVVLLLALVGVGYYAFGLKSDNADIQKKYDTLNSNPKVATLLQNEALIKKVGALTTLPTGEDPAVVAVSDAAKAKQQSAFFNDAQNGDEVLLYSKAGKAILYRPSTNKVILTAPLTFTNNTSTPATTTKTTTPATTTTTKKP